MPSTNTWSATGSPGSAGTKTASGTGRERTWNNTPLFGSLPKDEKPVNGYADRRYKSEQTKLKMVRTPTGGSPFTVRDEYYYENGGIAADSDLIAEERLGWTAYRSKLYNETMVKALVKMADAKVNVAVAYAEASKTSDLILDTARRVDRAYRAFRKGDLKGVAQNLNITPRRLHKSWLEYKYGWLPLLMDVKGAAEFFAQQHVVRPARFQVSAKEKYIAYDSYDTPLEAWGGGSTLMKTFFSGNMEVKVKIWCELTSPHLSEMQQLGLTNPALVAWELVPFSFVFDWFVQVGDWLTALTAQQGVTVRRSMYSIIEDLGYSRSRPSTVRSDLVYTYEMSSFSWAGSIRRYTRSIPDLNPFTLYPPVTNSFGFAKLVTSLALIQGNYRGTSRTARI